MPLSPTLKVMSFNIRTASASDGENGWEHRKALVVERIRAFDPDLIGMQECRDDAQATSSEACCPTMTSTASRVAGTPSRVRESVRRLMPAAYLAPSTELYPAPLFRTILPSANSSNQADTSGAISMPTLTEPGRFVTDSAGNRIAVILDLERYEELLEAMEELDDIRAFDEARAAGDETIPFEQAVQEIEQGRR